MPMPMAPAIAVTTGWRVTIRTTMKTTETASGARTDGSTSFVIVKTIRNMRPGRIDSTRPRMPPIAPSSAPAVGASPGVTLPRPLFFAAAAIASESDGDAEPEPSWDRVLLLVHHPLLVGHSVVPPVTGPEGAVPA